MRTNGSNRKASVVAACAVLARGFAGASRVGHRSAHGSQRAGVGRAIMAPIPHVVAVTRASVLDRPMAAVTVPLTTRREAACGDASWS
jgi:hypothetical protein